MRAHAVAGLLHGGDDALRGLALDVDEGAALQDVESIVFLILSEVDSADLQTHCCGVLAANMAEATACTEDGDPLARLRLCLLQRFVGGHTRTQQRSSLHERHSIRDAPNVARLCHSVLSEATVRGEAGLVLLATDGLPARQAIVAAAARVVQPCVADTIPDLERGDAFAQLHNDTRTLVAGDDRKCRLDMPVAIADMKIRVANPRADDLDQDLSVARLWHRDLLEHQRLSELHYERRLHRLWDFESHACVVHARVEER
mmetsp:Transcript_63938/g.162049  ORF Transcript_63938/g.162049 Transcript_63938/m.162049 type:complete len:259 (+) Transcript_63938:661-1437(+)